MKDVFKVDLAPGHVGVLWGVFLPETNSTHLTKRNDHLPIISNRFSGAMC